jgi:CRP/FNR family transcriptional regulator
MRTFDLAQDAPSRTGDHHKWRVRIHVETIVNSSTDVRPSRRRSTADNVIPLHKRERSCRECPVLALCLPANLAAEELRAFSRQIDGRRALREGETLFRAGDSFEVLYAVNSGSVKTSILPEDGREQVAGYYMQGEIVGFDGIVSGRHTCSSAALERSVVCAVPFAPLEQLARSMPMLQQCIYRMLTREVARNHDIMLQFGIRDAQVRLVAFLLDLAKRCRRCGLSASDLTLRLSRAEMGSYLGLNLATVSRALSRLQDAGLMQVQGRHIKLLDPPSLKSLVAGETPRVRA